MRHLTNHRSDRYPRHRDWWRAIVLAAISAAVWGLATLPIVAQPEPSAEAGQTLFEQRCASCHTVGDGDLVGPDLQGVTERRDPDWLRRFIANPDEMRQTDETAQKVAAEYAASMPNLGLSESQVANLIAYLRQQDRTSSDEQEPASEPTQTGSQRSDDQDTTTPSQQQTPSQTTEPSASTDESPSSDAAIGRALFTGTMSFSNGGPSCISCHSAGNVGPLGGGTLDVRSGRTPGLTNVLERYGGRQGLASFLKNPPTPTMQAVWSDRPLTDEETAQLIAFFQASGAARPPSAVWQLALLALGGALLLLLVMRFVWRRRLRAVREPLARRHY